MRVLVCGGRRYSNRDHLWSVLDQKNDLTPISCIIEGEASGADTLAREWAQDRGILLIAFHADWSRYNKAAGPIRNRQMLAEGKPDRVIAFFDEPWEKSRGTRDMVLRARAAGIEVDIADQVDGVNYEL